MTDEDMPSDADLRRRFAARLRDELATLERDSRETAQSREPVALDQQSVGRLSRIDAMQTQAMAQANDRRRETRKLQIATALRRFELGTFGLCAGCQEFIGMKRLGFDPATVQCMACARARE
ncbi:MAG: TraR/DksA family transcriptional regulator [Alphaproteobacteria bacterium]